MIRRIHAAAGVIGFLTILTFWTSTLVSELFASQATVAAIKHAILWGMLVLVPAMAAAGGSGFQLLKGRTDAPALAKKRRMMVIGPNGLLVLIPCAFYLARAAAAGRFDGMFYAVQALELIAGLTNLTLMGLNIRDGLRLTGRIAGDRGLAPRESASIAPAQNGPLVVSGAARLQGPDGATLPAKPTMALCRCGASNNKPFCDGSHNKIGFTSALSPERTPDGGEDYRGAQITVSFNRLLCSASEECAHRLPEVFRKGEKPWIQPDRADVQRVIAAVEACPSGALRYAHGGRSGPVHARREPLIRIRRDGPYEVEGGLALGSAVWCEGASQEHYALCRCGASKNKPFCDGSHHKAGFSG